MKRLSLITVTALSLALIGCGSGGYKGPDNPPPNQPPPSYPGGMASKTSPQETAEAGKTAEQGSVPSDSAATSPAH